MEIVCETIKTTQMSTFKLFTDGEYLKWDIYFMDLSCMIDIGGYYFVSTLVCWPCPGNLTKIRDIIILGASQKRLYV